MRDRYEPSEFEAKWRARWKDSDLFKTREEPDRPKFYGLDFFPYPSGAGLSVGHCRNFIPTDVICRMKFMQGYNVLHPMGFDAFGLPAENEAIKRKRNPAEMIDEYAATYQRQMELVGISYDWSREFKSCDPSYYKWTQWIFEQFYKKGLAYRKLADVNWCPKDKTALANEEVVGGLCERCGTPVEKKAIPQWYFRITAYAQRLLDDLDTIDWPEGIKAQQRNWIGRSEGVEFEMKIQAPGESGTAGRYDLSSASAAAKPLTMRVFTTRIDTIFGMTFCVIAPEHPLVEEMLARVSEAKRAEIEAYRAEARRTDEATRTAVDRPKTGCDTGFVAINPATGHPVPVFVADYVLMGYGTGAIMAVPAGDQRDFEFAQQFGIPVVPIQNPTNEWLRSQGRDDTDQARQDYLQDPKRFRNAFVSKDEPLINAGEYTGMAFEDAAKALGEWIEGLGIGERKVNFRLRDWLISRQRYWGCPIPVVHTKDGEEELVPESQLPVYLPTVDHYEPADDGSSPLSLIQDFVNVTTSEGTLGRRETDTMGGFACSSWYFLRFADPHNDDAPWDQDKVDYWLPVDCYVGGAEHAVMHLLYARFWTKVFYDLGLVKFQEPFARLQNQGQVLAMTPYRKPHENETLGVGEDGVLISFEEAEQLPKDDLMWRWARMSKSKGNVVTPDEAVEAFGADALRLYELFVAPFDSEVQWTNEGMNGMVRFLSRIFKLSAECASHFESDWRARIESTPMDGAAKRIRAATHKAILKVSDDIEKFAFNTAVSTLMIFANTLADELKAVQGNDAERLALSEAIETMILLLAPMAPHSADEMWESLGRAGSTYQAVWPTAIPELAVDDVITIAVQVNGKLRDTIEVAAGLPQAELEQIALASEKVKAQLDGKTVRKVIVVPDRLVNVVVG